MVASTKWAAFSGLAIVVAALVGTAAWRRLHPEAPSPLAALNPTIKQLTPAAAPTPAPAPSAATTASSAAPPSLLAPVEAAKAPDRGLEPPIAPNPSSDAVPRFDVVRVEPSGDTVVAGKGKPESEISLLASGKVVAQAKADANGQFVMTPPALKPGAYDLSLQQKTPGSAATESRQAVAVAVPEKGKGQVVVALAEPGRPTQVLAAPAPEPPSAPNPSEAAASAEPPKAAAPAPQLTIRTVELENATGFYVTGTAPPQTHLRVYLNDSHLADLTPGADGAWTLRIRQGLSGGRYTVRADALGAADGKVVGRVEVPFDVPASVAEVTPEAPAPGAAPHAVEPKLGDANSRAADSRAAESRAAKSRAATSEAPARVASQDAPQPPSAPNPDAAAVRQETAPATAPNTGEAAKTEASPPVPTQQRAEANSASAPSNAVIESIETAIVAPGDNLWNISRVRLGQGMRYTRIYTANASQIRDPNLIYPGQVFVLPKD